MTHRMLDAMLIAGQYLCYAAAVFPLAAVRIVVRLDDDLRAVLDNRKART